jgi:hypothetical protein
MAELRIAVAGFRVKSGWAATVLIAGPIETPVVLDRRVVELADPRLPETRQPYHAGTGREETDSTKILRRVKAVKRAAQRSIADLLALYLEQGCRPRRAGLVVGSLVDPDSIANPHVRAHALEGKLFRTALVEALGTARLPCRIVLERNAYAEGEGLLGVKSSELVRRLAELGRPVGRPWGANEKVAALAAWMNLKPR